MSSTIKVLHFDISFFPSKSGSFQRLYNLIKNANFTEHVIISNTLNGPSSYEDISIVRLKRSFLNLFKYYKLSLRKDISVLFIHNSIIALYLLPILLLTNKKKIIEIHSIRKTGFLYDLINQFLYSVVFNKISVLSFAMKDFLIDRYSIKENKIYVVYNGYDDLTKSLNHYDESPVSKKLNSSTNICTIGYFGSLYEWQGIVDLLKSIKLIYEKKIDFIKCEIYGDGPLRDFLVRFIYDNKLDNIIFYKGEINKHEIQYCLKNIDALIIPRPSSLATETIVPLKIFDYISYTKPIIMSNVGGLTEILNNDECLIFEPGNIDDLSKTLIGFCLNKEKYQEFSFKAYKRLNDFNDWEKQSFLYEDMILNE